MLGILTVESHLSLRKASRDTFLSKRKFGHRFLFDRETPALLREQEMFGDLVFLNTSYTGKEIAFGEKLLLWLKYAKKHFPNYTLYGKSYLKSYLKLDPDPHPPVSSTAILGKADDDVFICAEEFMVNLERVATRRLHYGWWHWQQWEQHPGIFQGFGEVSLRNTSSLVPKIPDIDEFIIIMGSDLIDPIIHPSRKHCIPKDCSGSKFTVGRVTCKVWFLKRSYGFVIFVEI